MTQPLTTAELQRIIQQWDDGTGVTAAVQAFAQALPVAERTVWYWIGGRKIHPAMAEWISQVASLKKASMSSATAPKKTEHEFGTIQGSPVRPFLKAACDKLAKQMGERMLKDYRDALRGAKPAKRKRNRKDHP